MRTQRSEMHFGTGKINSSSSSIKRGSFHRGSFDWVIVLSFDEEEKKKERERAELLYSSENRIFVFRGMN